jgi:hypothetical protein
MRLSVVEREFRLVRREVQGFPNAVLDQIEVLRDAHEIE